MSVSAIIVTRGDVDLSPVLDSLPTEWQMIVYDNGKGEIRVYDKGGQRGGISWLKVDQPDLLVYGRYAAIEFAHWDMIYVQDDDVIVGDPRALVHAWMIAVDRSGHDPDTVVCNMPQEFRHEFYSDHSLVGFGAAFHRDAPTRAFRKMWTGMQKSRGLDFAAMANTRSLQEALQLGMNPRMWPEQFLRTCDIVFTGLSPRVLVDIPKENLPYAEADNRMWKQPTHQWERANMRERMLEVRREME